MSERGFILTPTYRVVARRPVVHLYAVLENGAPVLVVDDRLVPYFFVPAAAAGGSLRPASPAWKRTSASPTAT